jgi:NADH-quinone oxidoreductase subunit A
MSGLVGYMILFLLIGIGFILANLLVGSIIRPRKPNDEKATIYECGEPTIGSAWIQFDLRFYVVALLFVIFDVEVAFFFPWAVVFGQANTLSKPEAASPAQLAIARQELGRGVPVTADNEADARAAAGSFARLALVDILVFFGVLLVGFAYLWARGDRKWVRSLAAEEPQPPAEEDWEASRQEGELAGAAR